MKKFLMEAFKLLIVCMVSGIGFMLGTFIVCLILDIFGTIISLF